MKMFFNITIRKQVYFSTVCTERTYNSASEKTDYIILYIID